MIILTALAFAAIALLSYPALKRQKNKREIVLFGIVFALVFAYAALFVLGVEVPNTISLLHEFVGKTLGLDYRRFRSGG